ncbi:transglycosylase SLT domain-containing protein [Aurantimonas sp. A2-1-M11]|uniref:lytic transglycosylase domain-containing protein n=1 Tax=Aurantimonas sp. A2-1-M11 TaxID=3113712 RepID=UPI002F93CA23
MTLPRIARAGSARVARAAMFGMIASLAALAGCIADGPGGSPMGLNLADGGETTHVASDAEAPAEADVAVAAKEARAAAEAGSISGSAALDRLIERHAAEAGVPTALAYAVVRVESRYNPKARGAGVYGLSQIKPATARSLGFSGPASALFDADTNLTYGMKYLKGAWEKGGHDVCQASMKYKGGHRATRMSASAKRYCSAVKAHMAEVSKRRRMPDTIVEPQAEPGLVGTLVAAVTPTQAKTAAPAASTTDATITKQTAAARPADKPVVAAAYAAAPKPAAIPRPEAPEEAKGAPADAATPQPAATAVVDSGKGGRVAAHPAPADPLAARMAGTDDLATELRGSGTD